jgi:hypothetical protein
MARKQLSAAKLYALLDREFRKVRPVDCGKCRIPLPFFREPADEFTANWHIGTPTECPHRCHLYIAEVLARLWTQYDLEHEGDERKEPA